MDRIITSGYVKSTEDFKNLEKIDFWRDVICEEFVHLDFDSNARENFRGELRGGVGFPDLSFAEVVANEQEVTRSRSKIAAAGEEMFLISFQLESEGIVKQSGRHARLVPGSFALYDSTQPYSLSFAKDFHQLVLHMPRSVLKRYLVEPEKFTAIAIDGGEGLGAVVTDFLFSLVREVQTIKHHPEGLTDNLVNLIAMALSSSVMLDTGLQSITSKEALKRRVLNYIENNLCDPGLTNEQIANAQGVSARYLHKLFQEEEVSVHHQIRNKRLEHAKELLGDPHFADQSIERICFSVGYVNAAHFSRSFKQHFGVSPSEMRQKLSKTEGK